MSDLTRNTASGAWIKDLDMGDGFHAERVAVGKQVFTLLEDATSTGLGAGPVTGGDYLWRVEGAFGGATATLQYLGLDGVTWFDATETDGTTPVTLTASGAKPVGIAQGSVVRVELVGGAPSAMNSVIGGL
ncbi:hypothetical protein GCM10007913_11760 [Devosia yakushimensis]|uniref:Uncharacterized protein n=1 Tax=Devosia yakushimensis TaxID=470028 RepID=A0ABQ5UAV6_9HYPH|nr:hypothetical protein [Devosia yakushimensis]GLQ09244.1 hypothetical protein GCM10007913_11760 [Devosia yakushimensis]